MAPTEMEFELGTHVRCRSTSGHLADCVVTAVRHFPVDFIEVQFQTDGRRMAVTRSEIAKAIVSTR